MITKPTKLSQVIHLIVKGLEDPPVTIKTNTFGYRDGYNFYGCAATCVLILCGADKELLPILLDLEKPSGFSYVYSNDYWVSLLELAVDSLRFGHLSDYYFIGWFASMNITCPDNVRELWKVLPFIGMNYTKEHLMDYSKVATQLAEQGY